MSLLAARVPKSENRETRRNGSFGKIMFMFCFHVKPAQIHTSPQALELKWLFTTAATAGRGRTAVHPRHPFTTRRLQPRKSRVFRQKSRDFSTNASVLSGFLATKFNQSGNFSKKTAKSPFQAIPKKHIRPKAERGPSPMKRLTRPSAAPARNILLLRGHGHGDHDAAWGFRSLRRDEAVSDNTDCNSERQSAAKTEPGLDQIVIAHKSSPERLVRAMSYYVFINCTPAPSRQVGVNLSEPIKNSTKITPTRAFGLAKASMECPKLVVKKSFQRKNIFDGANSSRRR